MALLLQALREVRTLHGDLELLPAVVRRDSLDRLHPTRDFGEPLTTDPKTVTRLIVNGKPAEVAVAPVDSNIR